MNETLPSLFTQHIARMKDRHERALEATGHDAVVIYGGSQHMIFLDDMPYPFKVNPHFKSWVPVLDNPHSFVIYRRGERPKLLHYQPVDFWHKPAADPSGFWVEHFDITPIANLDDAVKQFHADRSRTAFVGEWDPAFESWGLNDRNPKALLDFLHFDRAWKTEYEIECMREANRIGARAHRAAEQAFRDGASEYEIHLTYMRAATHNEAELPYGNIIALNENAAVLHYQHQSRTRPSTVHSFLIDAGAHFNGYASDITRTYSGANDEFAAMIRSMDAGQLELCAMIRPGLDYKEVHNAAHRHVGKMLAEFGIVKGSAEEAVEKKITSTFLPHGVGHYIGLQVHDVGGFMLDSAGGTIPKPEGHPFLRLTRVVEETQVFTIEPGIYFIDSLLNDLRAGENSKLVNWDKVDTFRKFGGIRIEDDIVVRKDGHENLTRDAFKDA